MVTRRVETYNYDLSTSIKNKLPSLVVYNFFFICVRSSMYGYLK